MTPEEDLRIQAIEKRLVALEAYVPPTIALIDIEAYVTKIKKALEVSPAQIKFIS